MDVSSNDLKKFNFLNCNFILAITYADLVTVNPFENTMDIFELRGDHLLQTLEYSIRNRPTVGYNFFAINMLQVTGET